MKPVRIIPPVHSSFETALYPLQGFLWDFLYGRLSTPEHVHHKPSNRNLIYYILDMWVGSARSHPPIPRIVAQVGRGWDWWKSCRTHPKQWTWILAYQTYIQVFQWIFSWFCFPLLYFSACNRSVDFTT